jgi:predicted DNA-binding transcriptional regulator AlpA
MERLLTMPEVQETLRISRSTLRELINKDPSFRTVKLARRRLMSAAALSEYVRSREQSLPGQANK